MTEKLEPISDEDIDAYRATLNAKLPPLLKKQRKRVGADHPCGDEKDKTHIHCFREKEHKGPHRNGKVEWRTGKK